MNQKSMLPVTAMCAAVAATAGEGMEEVFNTEITPPEPGTRKVLTGGLYGSAEAPKLAESTIHLYHKHHPDRMRQRRDTVPFRLDESGRVIEYRGVKCPYPIVTEETFLSMPCELSDDPVKISSVAYELIDSTQALHGRAAGLAANQLGHRIRILVIQYGAHMVLSMYDPQITKTRGGVKSHMEQCLSRPGKDPIKVDRSERVTVTYLDPFDVTAERKMIKLHGLDAQVLQHELDHLNGILI
jgi:peptide deformylase